MLHSVFGALMGSYGGVCVCERGCGCCCVLAYVAWGCVVFACVRVRTSVCVFECMCVRVCGVRLCVCALWICVCVRCVRVCARNFVHVCVLDVARVRC